MFTTNSMSKLQVHTTYKAERLYTNQGTHGDEDLCIWEPTLPDGYFMIGHYAQRNHDMVLGGPIPIVKTTYPPAIAAPVGFTKVYDDQGTHGKHDVSLWIPTPPNNQYVSLGTVCSPNYDPPTDLLSKYACIHKDLVVQGEFPMQIWNDKGSGGKEHVSLWAVEPHQDSPGLTGFFVAQPGYNQPPASLAQCVVGNVSS